MASLPRFNDQRIRNAQQRLNESHLYLLLKDARDNDQQNLMELTWEEAFELAADAEQQLKQLLATDPAFNYFSNMTHTYLKLAELLEKRQAYLQFID